MRHQSLLTEVSTAVVTDKAVKALLKKSGVTLTIKNNSSAVSSFRAFLQPLRYKNKIYLRGVATELGYDSLKKYLLISPADVDLSGVDGTNCSLYFGDSHLSIDHSETVYFGENPFYVWSIVSKEE